MGLSNANLHETNGSDHPTKGCMGSLPYVLTMRFVYIFGLRNERGDINLTVDFLLLICYNNRKRLYFDFLKKSSGR